MQIYYRVMIFDALFDGSLDTLTPHHQLGYEILKCPNTLVCSLSCSTLCKHMLVCLLVPLERTLKHSPTDTHTHTHT